MDFRVLLLFAACLSTGAALRCYSCSSKDGEYCSDTEIWKRRISPAECPQDLTYDGLDTFDSVARGLGIDFTPDTHSRPSGRRPRLACLKAYYSSPNGIGYTERKCVARGSNVCFQAGHETGKGRLDYCGTCSYDGCNSAGRLGGNYFWLLPLLALLRWR